MSGSTYPAQCHSVSIRVWLAGSSHMKIGGTLTGTIRPFIPSVNALIPARLRIGIDDRGSPAVRGMSHRE